MAHPHLAPLNTDILKNALPPDILAYRRMIGDHRPEEPSKVAYDICMHASRFSHPPEVEIFLSTYDWDRAVVYRDTLLGVDMLQQKREQQRASLTYAQAEALERKKGARYFLSPTDYATMPDTLLALRMVAKEICPDYRFALCEPIREQLTNNVRAGISNRFPLMTPERVAAIWALG